jgi:cation transport regulator ChaC
MLFGTPPAERIEDDPATVAGFRRVVCWSSTWFEFRLDRAVELK